MIQLDEQLSAETDPSGAVAYKTQAVLLPNSFFLNPAIKVDWTNNTCSVDGKTYYLDKSMIKSATSVQIPSQSDWLNHYGNYIITENYTFMDSKNNPSNNHDNVYRRKYMDSQKVCKYIFEYAWDQNDNNIMIRSLAPDGAEAQKERIFVTLTIYNNNNKRTEKIEKGDTAYIQPLPDDYKDRFRGWVHKGNMLPINEEGVSYLIMTADEEISAVWTKVCKLVLMNNGDIYSEQEHYNNDVVQLPTLDDTSSAYFLGWKMETGDIITSPMIIRDDMVLYAGYQSWVSISLTSTDGQTLSYHDGRGKQGEIITMEALNELITTPKYEKEGIRYTFDGWYLGVNPILATGVVVDVAPIEITAKWNETII